MSTKRTVAHDLDAWGRAALRALSRGAAGVPGREIAAGVSIGARARIAGSAVLVPPVILGDDVEIGAGARLERAIVADGTAVGAGAVVFDCLVARVPDDIAA